MKKYYEIVETYEKVNTKINVINVFTRVKIYRKKHLSIFVHDDFYKYIEIERKDYRTMITYKSNTTMISLEVAYHQELELIKQQLQKDGYYEIERTN